MIWVLLVGMLAISYGWGMRGSLIGHGHGAMLPGALLGFFFAAAGRALGVPGMWEHSWVFCGVGAAAMFYGGDMTYGQTIGMSHEEDPHSYHHGMLGLYLKGLFWFGVAAGMLGIAVSAVCRGLYPDWALIGGALLIFPLRTLGIKLMNRPHAPEKGILPKLYFSKTRPECWGGCLFVWLELLAVMIAFGDWQSIVISVLAAIGGGTGWYVGNQMYIWSSRPFANGKLFLGRLNRAGFVGGWKMMECTIGAAGGLFAIGAFWLVYGCGNTAWDVSRFARLDAPETWTTILGAVWVALVLLYSHLAVTASKLPPYRPDLDHRRALDTISQKSYDKLLPFATDKKPPVLLKFLLDYSTPLDLLVYAVFPIILAALGSAFAIRATGLFVLYWVALEVIIYDRGIQSDKKWVRVFYSVILYLLAMALLAVEVFEFPGGPNGQWVVLLCTGWYMFLNMQNCWVPYLRKKPANGEKRKRDDGVTRDAYFLFACAVIALWYFLVR